MKKVIPYLIVILFIVVFDQWSKIYISANFYLGEQLSVIDGFFNLKYVHNKGAAFGFGGNYADSLRLILFKILPVLACGWLFVLLLKEIGRNKLMTWAYTFVLGGAIGNIIDRIRLDYVVDFFDFYLVTGDKLAGKAKAHHFATFNIADSFITIAALLIIADYLISKKEKYRSAENEN